MKDTEARNDIHLFRARLNTIEEQLKHINDYESGIPNDIFFNPGCGNGIEKVGGNYRIDNIKSIIGIILDYLNVEIVSTPKVESKIILKKKEPKK